MGTSLYEQYQREKANPPKGGALYQQYLREKGNADTEALFRENGLMGEAAPRESVRLDVRQPSESTGAGPRVPNEKRSGIPNLIPGLASAPAGLAAIAREPETRQALTGFAAGAAQAIPGMRAIQAGARAFSRGQSYRDALGDIDEATHTVPREIRAVSQLPGVIALSPLLPANPAAAGALIGGADQAFDANPDVGLGERAGRAAIGAVAGGVAGKVVDTGVTAARAALTPTTGAQGVARQGAMAAADKAAYGAAEKEAALAGGNHPALANALNEPSVAPFAKAVRETEQFANADNATVLAETYKLMSETQRRLGRTMVNSTDYRAGSSLQKAEIEIGKRKLLAAADNIMPGFRKAVEQHAKMAGESEAAQDAAAVTRRIITKSSGNPAKPRTSPEAFSKRIAKMSDAERKAAVKGMLGELRSKIGVTGNSISLFGAATTALRPGRVSPFLRDLGGTATQDEIYKRALLSSLGIIDH